MTNEQKLNQSTDYADIKNKISTSSKSVSRISGIGRFSLTFL
jgi:hypothetical protein